MLSGESSGDLLWYRIQLDQVQDVLARHEVTRHDPWYDKVHWGLITTKLHDLLQRACSDGSADMRELMVMPKVS